MATEEGKKVEAAAFGYPAPVRPGATRVGWIGIGVMGGAMAGRLLAAGYAVTTYARTPAKADSLVAAGASLADSPAAVAAASDVVFTMVGNPGDVRAVVLDAATGALVGLRPGAVLMDCTSSSPNLAREVAAAARAAGCHAVDAPVSGGDVGARDGALGILAGGDEAVVAWLAPLLACLGRPTYIGPPGSGQSSKIANQIAVAGAVVGLSESLAFADAAGLDAQQFLGAVSKGAAGSRVMDLFGERVLSRDFVTGGAGRCHRRRAQGDAADQAEQGRTAKEQDEVTWACARAGLARGSLPERGRARRRRRRMQAWTWAERSGEEEARGRVANTGRGDVLGA